jgi:putative hydrolase of the HAD superfamily
MGGADPAACWHVGDRLRDDALGATEAGLHGVWLCRNPDVPDDPRVPTIRSLTEFPALVLGQ